MSQGEALAATRDDLQSRPSFELALRGYDKRQVEQYISQKDREMSALTADRDRALRQIQDLAAQLLQVQEEVSELQSRPLERASFRDLGHTVDQILSLAERQAQEITDRASQRAADCQSEAEKLLADARQRAEWLRADSEAAHERAQQEAKRINEATAQQAEQARVDAEGLVESARTQAQQEIEAARAETQQEVQARQQTLTQLQAEVDAAQQQLAQVRQEGASLEREIAQLQQRLSETNQDLTAELDRLEQAKQSAAEAQRHAKQVRARVQREAERVAQLAAEAVMAAAARGPETGEYPVVARPSGGANGAGESPRSHDEVTVRPLAALTDATPPAGLPEAIRSAGLPEAGGAASASEPAKPSEPDSVSTPGDSPADGAADAHHNGTDSATAAALSEPTRAHETTVVVPAAKPLFEPPAAAGTSLFEPPAPRVLPAPLPVTEGEGRDSPEAPHLPPLPHRLPRSRPPGDG